MNPTAKKILVNTLKCFLSIGILLFIVHKFNVQWTALSDLIAEPIWIGVAVFLSLVVATTLANNRWKSFLGMIGVEESFWRLVCLNWKSGFLGLMIPSSQGYDVLRIYNIEKAHPESRGKVGSTVIVERIIGMICLIFIALTALMFVGEGSFVWPIMILIAIIAAIVFVVRNQWCAKKINVLLESSRFMPKASAYILKLYNGLHTFPFDGRLVWSIFLILMLQLSNILVVYCLFRACGCNVSLVYHLLYQPVISVITLIPITFGGIGLREGGFTYFYTPLGVDPGVLIAVSIAYYCIMTLLPALLGGVVYWTELVKTKK